jgi:hypothetical protein
VKFTRPRRLGGGGDEGPGSFELLGLTHHWALSLKGNWVVRRRTMRTRLARALHGAWKWCRDHGHLPLAEQSKALEQKLRGHYACFGIAGSYAAGARFATAVEHAWREWLGRRSQQGWVTWERLRLLLSRYALQPPRVVHGLCAGGWRTHELKSRMREICTYGSVGGPGEQSPGRPDLGPKPSVDGGGARW